MFKYHHFYSKKKVSFFTFDGFWGHQTFSLCSFGFEISFVYGKHVAFFLHEKFALEVDSGSKGDSIHQLYLLFLQSLQLLELPTFLPVGH
jgi:hypothetical protein